MASKRNKQHKLRLKKRGGYTKKKILRKLKMKPYTQRTTKRRYNKRRK